MTYTVLKPDLSRVGLLANTGSSPNQFWDDKITQGIAEQSEGIMSILWSGF
ncbi:hypothetical protein [Weissella soli]|uniref:hypothetical protein n=1 Tax=Weissella soli TaxID=155866 RepID=UPI001644F6E7|nr:hypothetical protein [Weissella soli]